MEEEKKGGSLIKIVVIVLILAVLGYGVFKYLKREEAPSSTNSTSTTTENAAGGTSALAYMYRDGQYFAQGSYTSPGGSEDIEVNLTIKEDVITDVSVNSLATRPMSVTMQGKFISGIKEAVVGKKLNEVVLTHVSGSSLTPIGWNDAIAKIQLQAKVQ